MYIAFFEVIAVAWFYGNQKRKISYLIESNDQSILGANRLSHNVKEMTGKEPHLFFVVCWYAVAPALILVRSNSVGFIIIFQLENCKTNRFVILLYQTKLE